MDKLLQIIIEGNYALISGPQFRVWILHNSQRWHKFKITSFRKHRKRLRLEKKEMGLNQWSVELTRSDFVFSRWESGLGHGAWRRVCREGPVEGRWTVEAAVRNGGKSWSEMKKKRVETDEWSHGWFQSEVIHTLSCLFRHVDKPIPYHIFYIYNKFIL